MRFPELLIEALKKSEIPLRFEPGAEESAAMAAGRAAVTAGRRHDSVAAAIAAALVTILGACGKTADDKTGKTGGESIAVFTKNQTNPFFQTVRLGAANAAKQMDASVIQYIPTVQDSIPEQMNEIEDAIIKRPGAVVIGDHLRGAAYP